MGMFDNIKVNFNLPKIKQIKGTLITQEALQTANYQTKSLDNSLTYYTINADRTITYDNYEKYTYVKDSDSSVGGYSKGETLQHCKLTGDHVIQFYEGFDFDEGDNDFWVEWTATVINGKLKSIKLSEFTPSCNKERKENQRLINSQLKEHAQYITSKRYKYFYKYVNRFTYKLKKVLLVILDKLTNLVFKM